MVLLGEPNKVVIEKVIVLDFRRFYRPRVRYSLMVLFVGFEQEGKAEEMGEELRVENENDESDSQV